MNQDLLETFSYFHDFWKRRGEKLRISAFKRVTKKSLPMFFRGQDIISILPMTSGVHEPAIKQLIDHSAASGYSDFLIDIGANIGLSSCQSGQHFKEVHMFEPNPNILNILKVNTKIMLKKHRYVIHEFGLGDEDGELDLYVPYDNWGGAFVLSSKNLYDKDLLSAKDGYGKFNIDNYEVLKVQIKSAQTYLKGLFDELRNKGLVNGVIKIDVEGFEKYIIEQLLAALPKDFKSILVFENWKEGLRLSDFSMPTDARIAAYSLVNNKTRFKALPRFVNSAINLILGGFRATLVSVNNDILPGTCVLKVN
jgi:FkbM family methyltransferase